MRSTTISLLSRGLLAATTTLSTFVLLAGQAAAQDTPPPEMSEHSPGIITNNNVPANTPAPAGALDLTGVTHGLATGVNGIGQMAIRPNPNTTGLSVCTATLINPRTVIFAAHCVNTRPASAYGPNGTANGLNPNGTPISIGFGANNQPALVDWLLGGPALRHQTNLARALFAAEEVWYDPRSLNPNSAGFLEADIAIATLDTPAFDVPTWAMLFSPLTATSHVTETGYGVNGTHATAQGPGGPCGGCGTLGGIDFRRRAAENMIVLLSLDDVDDWLFGQSFGNPQSLYMSDFDNPAGQGVGFNFDLFDGGALPREGITAGGDSGGPLVLDQTFNGRRITVATLSGGSRYFAQQRFSTYGTSNFYQPLFLFWDMIVAMNPYVYAGNKAGDGAWEDPGHWVQLMDPSYVVDRGGVLVNDTPDTPALGISGNTVKFGQICFLDDCTDAALDDTATPAPVGSGTGLHIPGGPGSENFVPNNVISNPLMGIRGRYYDVTLSEPGTTSLDSSVTIDRLTIDGPTMLNVGSSGSLRSLGDFTQSQGWTRIDGTLRAGEALIVSGLLSGNGTLRAPFTTVVGAIVAPGGGDAIGTLTVDGNLILASASALFVDVGRDAGDLLDVTGMLDLNGGALVFNKVGAAPRHGDTWEIVKAGAVNGTFGNIYSFQGVLRPELTYNADGVVAELRAGSLVHLIEEAGPIELAFAAALDQLRTSNYASLYDLYGIVDLMDAGTLSMTLRGLAPTIASESRSLQDRQSRLMLNGIADRLPTLGTAPTGTLSINGSPALTLAMAQGSAPAAPTAGLVPSSHAIGGLPRGMTGFANSGYVTGASATGANRLGVGGGRHIAYANMGLEVQATDHLTIGTAFGYAYGFSAPGLERTEARTTQVAAYGAYRLGGGAYVAALGSAEISRISMERHLATGNLAYDLYGASQTSRYQATIEAGANLDLGGLTLTPRAALAYSRHDLGGFEERGGDAALRLNRIGIERLESRLGARLAGQTRLGGWTLAPQIQADLVNSLSGADRGLSVAFANVPDVEFALPMFDGDRSWGEVRGGFTLSRGRVAIGAGVETMVGRSGFQDDRASADLTVRF